jgi:hypothetical protein
MARQYVTYEQVDYHLNRTLERWMDYGDHSPTDYLRFLRQQTGLSWAKLAHDLSVDSGCKVSEANARRWAR